MNVETLELDLGKRPGSEPTVFCRKGEKGALTLRATIADHGAEVDLSAFGVFFDCVTPDGRLVSDEATSKEGSTAVCTLNEAAMATAGLCKAAYFRLVGQDGSVSTTQDVRIAVLPSAFDAEGVAEAYVSEIERLLEECRSEFDANEAARQEASEAATKRANDAADLVEQAVSGNLDPLFAGWIDSKTMTPDDADDAWDGSAAAGLLAGTDAMERFAETVKREYDFLANSDGETIAYGPKEGHEGNVLHLVGIPAGMVDAEALAEQCISKGNLGLLLQIDLGLADMSGWGYDEYLKAFKETETESQQTEILATLDNATVSAWTAEQMRAIAVELMATPKNTFAGKINATAVNSWTVDDWSSFASIFAVAGQKTLLKKLDLAQKSWTDIDGIVNSVAANALASVVGMTKADTFGSLGSKTARIVGVNKDALSSGGGKARTTWSLTASIGQSKFQSLTWETSKIRQLCTNNFTNFPEELRQVIKTVKKSYDYAVYEANRYVNKTGEINETLFVGSPEEFSGGSVYDYFSGKALNEVLSAIGGGDSWTRDARYDSITDNTGYTAFQTGSGTVKLQFVKSKYDTNMNVTPFFCI